MIRYASFARFQKLHQLPTVHYVLLREKADLVT